MMTDFRALCAELTAWAEKTSAHYFQPPDVLLRARAALADEPAAPAPPADGEVAELVAWLQEEADDYECIGCEDSVARCKRAAELLERQVPVPVSERLPGPKDCDAEGRCWWGTPSFVNRSSVTQSAQWRLSAPDDRFGSELFWCHAHALPQPEVGE